MSTVRSASSQNYTIHSGDTLSGLAQRYGTSVSALMKANPQISDANKIYTGRSLNIPGARDGFDSARGGGSGHQLSGVGGGGGGGAGGAQDLNGDGVPDLGDSGPGTRGPGGSPFDIAKSELGKNAGSLKLEKSGVGAHMDDGIPNDINCANFVSGCLEQAGQISRSEHNNSVVGLSGNLDRDPNFQRVSLSQAKPGDVVAFNTPGGGHHVVLFAGMQNGRPTFIGSNNVNSDGSQRITMSAMNYPIMSIHHYVG